MTINIYEADTDTLHEIQGINTGSGEGSSELESRIAALESKIAALETGSNVVISSTAPDDKTAIWYDTSNM